MPQWPMVGRLATLMEVLAVATDLRTALKLDAAQLAQSAGLTQDQAAAVIGVSRSGWKRKLGLADEAGLHADEVVALASATGDCRMLDRMEAQLGRVAVQLPAPAEGAGDVHQRLLAVQVAQGRLAEQLVGRPVVEGTLPDLEAAIEGQLRELLALREVLRRQAGGRR